MQRFEPNQMQLNRDNIVKLLGLLDDLFDKLGVDEKTRKTICESIVGLCIKNPKLLPYFLMNLTDKKNHALLNFLHSVAKIAKQKNHQIETDFTLVLKFLLLSEKDLQKEFKKDPLLLLKMQKELKNLVEEVKQIAPEKAKELDKALNTVTKALDTMEDNLKNNKPLIATNEESPYEKLAREFIEGLRGFSKWGSYVSPKMGITNALGIVDDAKLEVEEDMGSALDWLAAHVFGMDHRIEGVAGDTLKEMDELNREKVANKESEKEMDRAHSSPFHVQHGAPRMVPPGSKEDG